LGSLNVDLKDGPAIAGGGVPNPKDGLWFGTKTHIDTPKLHGYLGGGKINFPGNPDGLPSTSRGNPGNTSGHVHPGFKYDPSRG
jgi:hypothetical protein